MKPNECPTCSSKDVRQIESVAAGSLINAYKQNFGVSIGHLFPDERGVIALHACGDCGLRWYTPSVSGDAAFCESLQRHSWYYQDDKPEYQFAKQKVGERDSVLEVGCGKGAFRRFLPAGVQYRGLEFNETAVASAKSTGLAVDIESIESHSVNNASAYDFVCHFQVLEHVTDPRAFLSACVSALKPGGTLAFAVPAEDSFLSVVEDGWLNMPPHHLTRWTDGALRATLESLGLLDIEIWHEQVAPYHSDWHRETMTCRGLKGVFRAPSRLQRDRIYSRIARKLEPVPVVGAWLRRRGEGEVAFSKNGHTVCVSARK